MPPAKKTAMGRWERHDASATAIKRFEEQFGKDMGFVPVRSDAIEPYSVVPTGILSLDVALKTGGLVEGRVYEFWGPEHVGKTSVAMIIVAAAQRARPKLMCSWVDMEQTFDKSWATQLGVDLRRLWLVENPRTAEDVGDSHRRFVESGLCSISVVDSVGSMISKGEFEKEADEAARVGAVASIVTRMVKQAAPMGRANGTISLIINQVRANVDTGGNPKAAKTITSGGWALKHVTTGRISIRRGGGDPKTVKLPGAKDPVTVSYPVAAKVEKNKAGPYGETAHFYLTNRATETHGPVGVDQIAESAQFGVDHGIIVQKGSFYTVPSGAQFRGLARVRDYLTEHPELVAEIRQRVIDSMAGQLVEESDEEPEEEGLDEVLDEVLGGER